MPAARFVRSGPARLPRPSILMTPITPGPLGVKEDPLAGGRVGRTVQPSEPRINIGA